MPRFIALCLILAVCWPLAIRPTKYLFGLEQAKSVSLLPAPEIPIVEFCRGVANPFKIFPWLMNIDTEWDGRKGDMVPGMFLAGSFLSIIVIGLGILVAINMILEVLFGPFPGEGCKATGPDNRHLIR